MIRIAMLLVGTVGLTGPMGHASAQFAPGAFDNSRIVGVWTWANPRNKCVETYDFRADGTLHLVSGEEKSENTYRLHAKPVPPTARHAMNLTVTRDYGGKDCGGESADDTGKSNTVYVQFDLTSGRAILICADPISNACFGPMVRK